MLHHGAGEHSGHYPRAVTKLAAAGYGAYALDARGHGRSEGRRASIDRFEQLTTDLHAVVSQAMRDHRDLAVFLLGYSLGGAGVLSYALKHLDELAGAIVVDSALGRGSGISRIQFGIASLLSAITPRALLIRLCGADLVGHPLLQRNTRRIRSSITAAAAPACSARWRPLCAACRLTSTGCGCPCCSSTARQTLPRARQTLVNSCTGRDHLITPSNSVQTDAMTFSTNTGRSRSRSRGYH